MQGSMKIAPALVLLVALIGIPALTVNIGPTPALAQNVRGDDAQGREGIVHLSELMSESMQVHHTKLWLAARANNWPLAAYEVRKIKDTFRQVKELIVQIQTASVKWQRVPVGEMLGIVNSTVNDLDHAVKAKDKASFETAYHRLTAACNACHKRADESQIKIIVPTDANAFVDQDFTTGTPQ